MTAQPNVDLTPADLSRLLARLQQSALRADAQRQRLLLSSSFERRKLTTSIQHARAILAAMERDALSVKAHAQRQIIQADLNRKREAIEELSERMRDLDEMAESHRSDDDDDEESSDADEDIMSALRSGADEILETPDESFDSSPVDESPIDEAATPTPPPQQPTPAAPEPTPPPSSTVVTSNTLRPRGPNAPSQQQPAEDTAMTTARRRNTLFGDRARDNDTSDLATTATTEAILDLQRAEQDQLSESILRMAGNLKESSRAFASSLEEDKAIVDRAGQGLTRNETGLEAAARRMGTLTRITEGEGWWGRMRLYAMVYGLMVFMILLVFVMPKLRF